MQKMIQRLPIIVIIAAVGIITYYATEYHHAEKMSDLEYTVAQKLLTSQLPVVTNLPEADSQLVKRALESPESFDRTKAPLPPLSAHCPADRPALLSSIEPDASSSSTNTMFRDPGDCFQKDFESLRTDAIRNPDSEYNRTVVKALMQKRQMRLAKQTK